MANKKFWLGMLVIVLVFGMTVVGCGAGGLNGTWDFTASSLGSKFKFENRTCQWIHREGTFNGIYTIKGNELTMNVNVGGDIRVLVYTFSVKGNTLTLTHDSGSSFTGVKESNSQNRGSSRITERSLVGVWELENVENVSRREVSDKDEFFADGTGITSQGSQNVSFTWQLRDGNRLQMDAGILGTEISVIELSENDRLLTYYLDDARSKKAMYRKK